MTKPPESVRTIGEVDLSHPLISMELAQKTKTACLEIAAGDYGQEKLTLVEAELAFIFGEVAARNYCLVLLSSGLISRINNLKDVKAYNIDTWYNARNTLIRYLAVYPEIASKTCPVYLMMAKARDSVNLI